MAQDMPQGRPEDEVHEEEVADQSIRGQEAYAQSNGMSPEEGRQLEDLGYRHLEEVSYSSGDGDGVGRIRGALFDD